MWIPTWGAWEEFLLTGNAHLAEDLLQTVLTRAASHWPKLARGGSPEAHARRPW
uniref:hypothetical protein n=1 Tax=Nonomuraea pusilla TaxID=46177 RepID=UPI000A75A7B1|nr:hypothetical protein [Nonomuraea pusilla]